MPSAFNDAESARADRPSAVEEAVLGTEEASQTYGRERLTHVEGHAEIGRVRVGHDLRIGGGSGNRVLVAAVFGDAGLADMVDRLVFDRHQFALRHQLNHPDIGALAAEVGGRQFELVGRHRPVHQVRARDLAKGGTCPELVRLPPQRGAGRVGRGAADGLADAGRRTREIFRDYSTARGRARAEPGELAERLPIQPKQGFGIVAVDGAGSRFRSWTPRAM